MNALALFWLENPANLLLAVLIAAVVWIGWRAQRDRDDVDFADVLRDDAGKVTWARFAAIGSFLASTWIVTAHYATTKVPSYEMLAVYLATWSGSALASKAIDVWKQRDAGGGANDNAAGNGGGQQ